MYRRRERDGGCRLSLAGYAPKSMRARSPQHPITEPEGHSGPDIKSQSSWTASKSTLLRRGALKNQVSLIQYVRAAVAEMYVLQP